MPGQGEMAAFFDLLEPGQPALHAFLHVLRRNRPGRGTAMQINELAHVLAPFERFCFRNVRSRGEWTCFSSTSATCRPRASLHPPIPKPGPLAQPRSHNQVGFPVLGDVNARTRGMNSLAVG